jgi:hypothetical protein
MIEHRPCGVCVALVPAATGCGHWEPGRTARADASRRDRDRARTALEAARERRRQAVDDFRKVMTGEQ